MGAGAGAGVSTGRCHGVWGDWGGCLAQQGLADPDRLCYISLDLC